MRGAHVNEADGQASGFQQGAATSFDLTHVAKLTTSNLNGDVRLRYNQFAGSTEAARSGSSASTRRAGTFAEAVSCCSSPVPGGVGGDD